MGRVCKLHVLVVFSPKIVFRKYERSYQCTRVLSMGNTTACVSQREYSRKQMRLFMSFLFYFNADKASLMRLIASTIFSSLVA